MSPSNTFMSLLPPVPIGEPTGFGIHVENFDYLVRVQATNSAVIAIGAPTAEVAKEMRDAFYHLSMPMTRACETLGLVIDRLKLRETYSNYYREFLLGNLPQAEFEKIADQYAYTPGTANLVELSEQLKVLLCYTTEEFTKNEAAELFRVTEEEIQSAIRLQIPLFGSLDSHAIR
jgi:hypothetical protein